MLQTAAKPQSEVTGSDMSLQTQLLETQSHDSKHRPGQKLLATTSASARHNLTPQGSPRTSPPNQAAASQCPANRRQVVTPTSGRRICRKTPPGCGTICEPNWVVLRLRVSLQRCPRNGSLWTPPAARLDAHHHYMAPVSVEQFPTLSSLLRSRLANTTPSTRSAWSE